MVPLLEKIEDLVDLTRFDAHAVVPNRNDRLHAFGAGRNFDVAARAGVLGRVGQKVHQDLLDPYGVRDQVEPLWAVRHSDVVALDLEEGPSGHDRRVDDRFQVH